MKAQGRMFQPTAERPEQCGLELAETEAENTSNEAG